MTNELIAKAKACKSAEELLALAKENGIEMTGEQAEARFAELHDNGELSDAELEGAAGGACSGFRESEIGDRFELGVGDRCPACGHEYAVIVNKDKRSMHGGSVTWYSFACEACKNVFSMTGWNGTQLN